MHVQPEAKKVKIGNRPLWAPGAPQLIEEFIAARGGDVRILEFGSGASTIFLLRRGATVVTVEHHAGWASELQGVAAARKIAGKLTILQRDRPYATVPDEFTDGTRFDIVLVDGRERMDCFRNALPLVKPDGLMLLDDSQRDRYWPAFRLLADRNCVTFQSEARSTTIWAMGQEPADPRFVRKSFVRSESVPPRRDAALLPRDFIGPSLEIDYVRREPIRLTDPVELKLQRLGLIEQEATFLSPSVYELEQSSVRIEAGQKLLDRDGAVFRARSGNFIRADDEPSFEGGVMVPGRTLDLSSAGAGRYSFFLLDSLPKLDLLGAAGVSIDDFDSILVNTGAPWVRDMIARVLGPGERNLIAFSPAQPSFKLERSVHIEGLRFARFTPAWIHDFVARTFPAEATGDETFGRRVYISRQRASGRQILNHDAFLDVIRPLGFVEVFAEDHTPAELAQRLHDAEVLISPHGAGLANLILAPAAATVIELFSSHYTPQYFHLARDRGQPYVALPCPDAEGKTVFDRYDATTRAKAQFNREDIDVPLDDLRRALTAVLGGEVASAATPVTSEPPVEDEQQSSLLKRFRFW